MLWSVMFDNSRAFKKKMHCLRFYKIFLFIVLETHLNFIFKMEYSNNFLSTLQLKVASCTHSAVTDSVAILYMAFW